MYNVTPAGIFPQPTGSLIDKLEPGFYEIGYDNDHGFCFIPSKPFEIKHKVYGSCLKNAERILKTFLQREGRHTSALFEGLKGSGKTLLTKQITNTFVTEHNGIVLVVNEPYAGTEFNQFLQTIKGPKIVVMDEFEKVYNDDNHLNQMLTLLDGTVQSHTMFLLSSNDDSSSLTRYSNLVNRPGRIYFRLCFGSISVDMIKEYCEDNLKDLTRLESIVAYTLSFSNFNMDMLSVLVRELNAYPEESLESLSEILNIKPDLTLENYQMSLKCFANGEDVSDTIDIRNWEIIEHFNLGNTINFSFQREDDKEEIDWEFKTTDLIEARTKERLYVWQDTEEDLTLRLELQLTRPQIPRFKHF